jgi:short/branched chain acyl-CoA dehydrogenase
MIDHRLTEDQEDLRKTVEEFAREVVAPAAAGHDANKTFPYEIVAQMGAMGLFGLPFPEEYGGMGGDFFTFCLAIEELARADSSVAITLDASVGLGAMPIFKFGTPLQRETWLPMLTAGKALAGFGLTEPGGGTDASAIRTTATLADGSWRINGSKAFITNSGTDITTFVTTLCVTGTKPDGRKELSTIIVPVPRPGVDVAPSYDKVGWHASDTHGISYADAAVPEDHLLGERGRGYANFLQSLDEGRVAISALAVGLAQGCVD